MNEKEKEELLACINRLSNASLHERIAFFIKAGILDKHGNLAKEYQIPKEAKMK